MKMISFTIALREMRHGLKGFGVFLACLTLGVAMIATVGNVSTAVNRAFDQQSKALLGGDIEILNNQKPLPDEVLQALKKYGDTSLSLEMRAMGRTQEHVSLVELKAVDAAYPLIGKVELSPAMALEDALRDNGVVMDDASLLRIGLHVGDHVSVGEVTLTIRAQIVTEPDRVVSTFSFGPRMLMSQETLQKTALLLPGSMVKYRYRLLLPEKISYQEFNKQFGEEFPRPTWKVRNFNQASETLEGVIDRFRVFLTLTALSALLIGGIGISGAVSRYLESKSETIAILKSLGAARSTIFTSYLLLVMLMGSIGIVLGIGFSVLLSVISVHFVGRFLPVDFSTAVYFYPLLEAALFGWLTILTFSLFALGRAADVKPALLFRGGLAGHSKIRRSIIVANYSVVVGFVVFTVWTAQDRLMALLFIQMAIACISVFWGFGETVMRIAQRIHPKRAWLRLAVANIHRPGATTVPTMLAIGVGLTVLITLLVVEGNISKRVNESIPEKAPSLFMIDIQPDQEEAFLQQLSAFDGISQIAYTPMLRGRVIKIADVPVDEVKVESSAQWVTRGDRGLTYMATQPENTKVVKGKWWPADYHGKTLLSLDSRVANGMHVDVGDTLTINAGGKDVTAEIANLREVDYTTLQINFAMVLSPGALDDLPHTFIATAKMASAEQEANAIQVLAKKFPNVSVVQISGILAQLDEVVKYVSLALALMISLTLFSGVLVLAGALAATQEKRAYDTVILKVLGARRKDIIKTYMAEWLLLALITAVISIGLGELFAWEILRRFRQTEFYPLPDVIAINLLVMFLVVTVLGFLGNMRAFQVKPASMLRNE